METATRAVRASPGQPGGRNIGSGAAKAVLAAIGLSLASAACTTTPSTPRIASTGQARPSSPPTAVIGQPSPDPGAPLSAVACAGPRKCWAVGSSAASPTADSPSTTTPTTTATSTATTTPGAAVIEATTDGGARWTSEHPPLPAGSALQDVVCPDSRHCTAVGYEPSSTGQTGQTGLVATTGDGGRNWQVQSAPAGSSDVDAVAVAAPGQLLVISAGAAGLTAAVGTASPNTTSSTSSTTSTSTASSLTWQALGALPAGFTGVTSLTCPTALECLAAGYTPVAPGQGTGAVAVTTDGGTSWSLASLPTGGGFLHSVACHGPSRCMAVGTAITAVTGVAPGTSVVLVSTDGGQTWASADTPSALGDAFAVACPTSRDCALVGTRWTTSGSAAPALGTGVVTTTDFGSTWRSPAVRYAPDGLDAVACPSAQRCVAAGSGTLAGVPLAGPAQPPLPAGM